LDEDLPAGGRLVTLRPTWESCMPLYEYELCDGNCAACGGRFTLRRPLSAAPLTQCPACRKPVKKIISGFNTPSITKPVSISDAKKAGFTVLKRVSKGEYERQ
jgi:putative FmdB family regulatory protein